LLLIDGGFITDAIGFCLLAAVWLRQKFFMKEGVVAPAT
jgi:UPF0716 family protein affecting phage T7 exclusion